MDYTHTLEIIVNGMNITGELSFQNDHPARIKIEGDIDMETVELKNLVDFITNIQHMCARCGEIQKIEIKKK